MESEVWEINFRDFKFQGFQISGISNFKDFKQVLKMESLKLLKSEIIEIKNRYRFGNLLIVAKSFFCR
jgi:hypothetical protein